MHHKIGVGYASATEIEKQYVLEALDSQRRGHGLPEADGNGD